MKKIELSVYDCISIIEPQMLQVIVLDSLDMDSVFVVVGTLADGLLGYAGQIGLLN